MRHTGTFSSRDIGTIKDEEVPCQTCYIIERLEQDVAVLKYDLSELRIEFKGFKQEMIESKNETMTRFDKVFGFLEKLDQERVFMHGAILRLDETVLRLDQECIFTHEAILRIEEKFLTAQNQIKNGLANGKLTEEEAAALKAEMEDTFKDLTAFKGTDRTVNSEERIYTRKELNELLNNIKTTKQS